MIEPGTAIQLKILETPAEIAHVEELQRLVWPGSETEIVPGHLLLTSARNGGIVIGAYPKDASSSESPKSLVGFVFGFPGLVGSNGSLKIKHCSHMLGVHPDARGLGIGLALKRAQWQMVRSQGIDLVTWTYDPLLSRNANLNIARLGAICSTYHREAYGELRDGLNSGLATDRFQVDWWVNSRRVERRFGKKPRLQLDLAHYLAAGVPILNPTSLGPEGLPWPSNHINTMQAPIDGKETPLLLVEIPPDFQALKSIDKGLAQIWRMHSRGWFEGLFALGFIVTDFVHLTGINPRSFYVLTYGESVI